MTTKTITPQPMEILNMNVITHMDYSATESTNHKCSICRRHIMAPTYGDMEKGVMFSRLVQGKCNHVFHAECINTVAKETQSCPIDKSPWTSLKYLDDSSAWKQHTADTVQHQETLTVKKAPPKPAVPVSANKHGFNNDTIKQLANTTNKKDMLEKLIKTHPVAQIPKLKHNVLPEMIVGIPNMSKKNTVDEID